MDDVFDEPSLRERLHVFKDRFHAGRVLAEMIRRHIDLENAVLFAIPAGGVPVGYVVSRKLGLPLDVIVVRKIQIPWDPEAGLGAVSWDGELVLNVELVRRLGIPPDLIQDLIKNTMEVVQDRLRRLRRKRPLPNVGKRAVILVDDGLASGFTMLAAIKSVKKGDPERIVVAVPTASKTAIELVSEEVDDLLCLNVRSGPIFAVADAYQEWYDLTDEEVEVLLRKAWGRDSTG